MTVEYSDGSVETGYSGNGKFATLRRTFDRNGSFQNATCGSNGKNIFDGSEVEVTYNNFAVRALPNAGLHSTYLVHKLVQWLWLSW